MSAIDRKPLTLQDVATMLQHVPAVDREIWLRIGMAIKSEFGDAGFKLWDAWSQTADSYNAGDAHAVWRSINGAGITLATLVHIAREHGWERSSTQFPTTSRIPPKALPTQPSTPGRRAYALELWLRAERDDELVAEHPYLQRKQFRHAHGGGLVAGVHSRQWEGAEDCLVIPIRAHGTGKVIAVQAITGPGQKCTFGSMTADDGTPGYLLLGNNLDPKARLFVAEGWADVISLVFLAYRGNACGAVAFGKSRLESVAEQVLADLRRMPVIVEEAK